MSASASGFGRSDRRFASRSATSELAELSVRAPALALAVARRRPLIALPVRLGVQVGSLLVTVDALRAALHLGSFGIASPTLAGLAVVAATVTLAAALANNLPASAAVAGLLSAGPASYAALPGLSAGALATPHGSVATLVSLDMSDCHGAAGSPVSGWPRPWPRWPRACSCCDSPPEKEAARRGRRAARGRSDAYV